MLGAALTLGLRKDALGIGFELEALEESLTGWLSVFYRVTRTMENVSGDAGAVDSLLGREIGGQRKPPRVCGAHSDKVRPPWPGSDIRLNAILTSL
jgi:hypothetical protein